jgi:hypothetical protein
MVAEVYAGLGAVKAAFDLAKGLKDINDAALRNSVLIELQQKILAAQQDQAELLQHLQEREQELAELKNWESEKQRFAPRELPPGVIVYALKDDMANGEPLYSICPTCYQRNKKSILHADEPNNGIYHLQCFECGTKLKIGHFRAPQRSYISHGIVQESCSKRRTDKRSVIRQSR